MLVSDKKRLGDAIQHRLGDRFIVIVQPVHPYLVHSPDILIGGDGLLTAIFTPTAPEIRSPLLLRARLTAARLALTENARCILYNTGDAGAIEESEGKSLEQDFDLVVWSESARGVAEIARDERIRMDRVHQLVEQRMRNAKRASIAMTLSEVAARRARADRSARVVDPSAPRAQIELELGQIAVRGIPSRADLKGTSPWPNRARIHPFHRNQQILMSASADQSGKVLSLAIRTAFINGYQMDMGVPYSWSERLPMVFPDTEIENVQLAERYVRASSLAGLVVGPAGSPSLIQKFVYLGDIASQRQLRRADLIDWL